MDEVDVDALVGEPAEQIMGPAWAILRGRDDDLPLRFDDEVRVD